MSDFTIANLEELDDMSGGRAPGIEARFGRSVLHAEHLGVTHLRYAAGVRSPMGHSHREQEEVYVVVAGSGRMKLGDGIVDVRPWDAVRVSPTTVRAFEAGPDGLELLAIGSDRPEGGDGVVAPDWWID